MSRFILALVLCVIGLNIPAFAETPPMAGGAIDTGANTGRSDRTLPVAKTVPANEPLWPKLEADQWIGRTGAIREAAQKVNYERFSSYIEQCTVYWTARGKTNAESKLLVSQECPDSGINKNFFVVSDSKLECIRGEANCTGHKEEQKLARLQWEAVVSAVHLAIRTHVGPNVFDLLIEQARDKVKDRYVGQNCHNKRALWKNIVCSKALSENIGTAMRYGAACDSHAKTFIDDRGRITPCKQR